MIPNTDYTEKSVSMADLIVRLRAAPERLAAAVEGLTPAECEAVPVPDEKSIRECVEHIAGVSLGWTNIFFEAIEGVYDTPRVHDPKWMAPQEAEAHASQAAALAVFRRHNAWVAEFLAKLPPDDWGRPFKVVAFLTEPFLIRESINWGCVIHCDWHLAQVQLKRQILGKPLDWLAVYAQRYPDAIAGHHVPGA